MDNIENVSSGGKTQKSKTTIVIAAIVIIIVLVAIWFWKVNNSVEKIDEGAFNETSTIGDTTEEINQQLEGIAPGDLEQEFKDIDADLNNL